MYSICYEVNGNVDLHKNLTLCVCSLTCPQVIPLLLQLVSRMQGVRSMSQTSGDSLALDEAKRQAKRPKTRRT